MKIYGNKPPDGQEVNLSSQKVSRARAQNKTPESGKPTSIDKVEISRQSKMVAELMSVVERLPEMRNEKIKALKEAIESGTYQVDSQTIAQKLIEEL
jgi:negative regulator of flagellin synthesis FlgM